MKADHILQWVMDVCMAACVGAGIFFVAGLGLLVSGVGECDAAPDYGYLRWVIAGAVAVPLIALRLQRRQVKQDGWEYRG